MTVVSEPASIWRLPPDLLALPVLGDFIGVQHFSPVWHDNCPWYPLTFATNQIITVVFRIVVVMGFITCPDPVTHTKSKFRQQSGNLAQQKVAVETKMRVLQRTDTGVCGRRKHGLFWLEKNLTPVFVTRPSAVRLLAWINPVVRVINIGPRLQIKAFVPVG